MEKGYEVRAYRWAGGQYEMTEPHIVPGKSREEARNRLAAHMGEGWKASEAFEAAFGGNLQLEQRLEIFEKLGYRIVRAERQAE